MIRCPVDEPIEIIGNDGPIDTRPKERAFVAALVLAHPRPLDISLATTAMWPHDPPATVRASFHNHVGRVRQIAPGLVASTPRGYALDHARVELPSTISAEHSRRLVELDGSNDIDHARHAFEEQSVGHEEFAAAMRRQDTATLLASLHLAVEVDRLDERAWWRLMVAQAASGDHPAVRSSLEQARASLADVGLEPSRRLDDIERRASSGITDVDRLLTDGFGESQEARPIADDAVDERFIDLRESLARDSDLRIQIVGDDTAERRILISSVVEEARVAGFGTVLLRCDSGGVCPELPDVSWPAHRPALVVVDRAETSTLGAELHARMRSVVRRKVGATTPVALAFTEAPIGHEAAGPAPDEPDGHTVRLEVQPQPLRLHTDRLDTLDTLGPEVVRLACFVELIGHPIAASDLIPIEPAAAELAPLGVRHGLLRHDARLGHIDLTDPATGAHLVGDLDQAARRQAAQALLNIDLTDDTPLRAELRRSRLAVLAVEHPGSTTESLARSASKALNATGDFGGGAAILGRLLEPIEEAEGRSARWCALALDAGSAAITSGSPDGERLLLSVVDAGRAIGELDVVVSAVLELCRLGPGSMAGDHDATMRALIDSLLAETDDPRHRARLGGAAAMVLSFTNEPDALREVFESAEASARESGDASLLVDVLPFTYMSLPLPTDLQRRIVNAADLDDAATSQDRADGRWEAAQLRLSNQVIAGSGDIRSTHQELETYANRLYERSRAWEMTYLRSNLALIDGDFDDARRHIDESLEFSGDIHSTRIEAVFGANHLAIALAEGTVGAFLDTVRTLANDQPEIGGWAAARALCAAEAGHTDEAIEAFTSWQHLHATRPVRDHTFTVATLALGEAAASAGLRSLLDDAVVLLEPFAGSWTWCGSCTFGPVDLTLARVHAARGDRAAAIRSATSVLSSCADLRAPTYSAAATTVLLQLSD